MHERSTEELALLGIEILRASEECSEIKGFSYSLGTWATIGTNRSGLARVWLVKRFAGIRW